MTDNIGSALEIDINYLVELAGAHFPKPGISIDNGGVIDDQMGSAVEIQQEAGPRFNLFIVGNIDHVKIMRVSVPLAKLLDLAFGAATAKDQVPETDKFIHHRAPEAAGGAGN